MHIPRNKLIVARLLIIGKISAGGGRLSKHISTPFQLIKRMVHFNACGIGLVLSPSAHVGSRNHGAVPPW